MNFDNTQRLVFVDAFLDAHRRPLREVVLDLDATDDPIHGTKEGRFFHGYYGNYCYLPLYIFAGDFLLCAKLRTSGIDASEGALEEVERIVARIRARWPATRIVLRADSGFARNCLMTWCEDNGVDFVFGPARNKRLEEMIAADSRRASAPWGCACRVAPHAWLPRLPGRSPRGGVRRAHVQPAWKRTTRPQRWPRGPRRVSASTGEVPASPLPQPPRSPPPHPLGGTGLLG